MQSDSVSDTPFCTCRCQGGKKTWMNEKAFNVHCSRTNCGASKRYRQDPEIVRQQVLQHQHDLENTSEFVSTIQHSITDSIAVMRFSDNMTHPQIGRSVVQTHNIQVASLDCVAAILKNIISPSQMRDVTVILDTLKECTSAVHYGSAKARTKLVNERFKPTPVSTFRSYTNDDGDIAYIADIPIDEALERLLQNPETCTAAFKPHTHHAGMYTDIRDGYLFRTHTIFKIDSFLTLALIIYADDFELLNPIGQKKGFHKVTVFYWQLVNLHPSVRVLKENIQVACVVLAKTLSDKHMPFVVRGDINNPLCKSIGGSFRRLDRGLFNDVNLT